MLNNQNGYLHYIQYDIKTNQFNTIKTIKEVKTPSSIIRAFLYENHYYLIHNNIYSNQQEPRNSLDISCLDSNLSIARTTNILFSEKDFFSNHFYILRNNSLMVVTQRLNRYIEWRRSIG